MEIDKTGNSGVHARGLYWDYTSIVKNMLEGITVHTNVDSNIWRKYNSDLLVYTGKLDNFFQNCRGELGYRSLEIKIEEAARQSCFQMNECNKGKPYTRTIDYSFLPSIGFLPVHVVILFFGGNFFNISEGSRNSILSLSLNSFIIS